MMCPMSENKTVLKQQPPSYVFKIVWPILYLLLGFSWNNARSNVELEILHGLCTLLLAMWIVIFSCMNNKKMGIYIIALSLATLVCCISMHNHKLSKIALIPLLAWLFVAFQLNWNIIE